MSVPSKDELTTYFKFGLKAIPVIVSLCPLKDLFRAGSPTEAKNFGGYAPPVAPCRVDCEGFIEIELFIFEFKFDCFVNQNTKIFNSIIMRL